MSHQTIYTMTSLPVEEYGAEELLVMVRKHWGIENGLHYRRDITFEEDACRQISTGDGRVLAVRNNLTINILRRSGWENLAKARRYFSFQIDKALNLISEADSRANLNKPYIIRKACN